MASICPHSSVEGRGEEERSRLLSVPSSEASQREWASAIPISDLPELPKRRMEYYAEPWCGVCLVGCLSVVLTGGTTVMGTAGHLGPLVSAVGIVAIWTWAILAAACTAYILFGRAGEVRRSPRTVYPIPQEVAKSLLARESLKDMPRKNIPGEDNRSFCVRCLVWRPRRSHHCNICQRCVTGFDHHCGVFGRCIVNGNMPCFGTLIGMMIAGFVTIGVVFLAEANEQARQEALRRSGAMNVEPYVTALPPQETVTVQPDRQVAFGPPDYSAPAGAPPTAVPPNPPSAQGQQRLRRLLSPRPPVSREEWAGEEDVPTEDVI